MKQVLPLVVIISAWIGFTQRASAQEELTIHCDTRLQCMEEFENKSIFEFLSPDGSSLNSLGDVNFGTFQGFVQQRSLSAADLKVSKNGAFEGFIQTDRALARPDYLYTRITFNGPNDDPPGAVVESSVTSNNELIVKPPRYYQFGAPPEDNGGAGGGEPEDLADLGYGLEVTFPDGVVICFGPCPRGEVRVCDYGDPACYGELMGMDSTGGGGYDSGGGSNESGGGGYGSSSGGDGGDGGDSSSGGGYYPPGGSSSSN